MTGNNELVSGITGDEDLPGESVESAGVVGLGGDDARFMSRVFRERDHEIAYCGSLNTNTEPPVLTVWLADTIGASDESVSFSTANCPPEMDDVIVHTHPNGVLGLSRTDRQSIQRRPETFTCVQGGALEASPGKRLDNVLCYRQVSPDEGELELMEVSVILYPGEGGS